jgi:hypothetical protein
MKDVGEALRLRLSETRKPVDVVAAFPFSGQASQKLDGKITDVRRLSGKFSLKVKVEMEEETVSLATFACCVPELFNYVLTGDLEENEENKDFLSVLKRIQDEEGSAVEEGWTASSFSTMRRSKKAAVEESLNTLDTILDKVDKLARNLLNFV